MIICSISMLCRVCLVLFWPKKGSQWTNSRGHIMGIEQALKWLLYKIHYFDQNAHFLMIICSIFLLLRVCLVLFWPKKAIFGTIVRHFSSRHSGGGLLAMMWWPLFLSVFPPPGFFLVSSVGTYSHRRSVQIKKLILQKWQTPFQTSLANLGPLAAILDFAGVAGSEQVPPAPLGWYLSSFSFYFFRSFFL